MNRPLLDQWIDRHSPNGILHLAILSEVGLETIKKARAKGIAPKKPITRRLICQVVGVEMDELFPLVTANGKAS